MQYIYKIENLQTNQFYIGRTHNIKQRWSTHWRLLNKGKHYNKFLQRAYIKYTSNNFEFKVIKVISIKDNPIYELEEAKNIEQYYLDNYVLGKEIYNISNSSKTGILTGQDHPAYGKTFREYVGDEIYFKVKEKQRENNKGEKNPFYGKKHSNAVLNNLRNDVRCKHNGKNNPFYGRQHLDEVKHKLSTIQKNRLKAGVVNNGKPITIKINGIIYRSKLNAAKSLGISINTLYRRIKNNYYEVEYI